MRPTPAPHRLQRQLLKRRLQAVRVGEEVAGVAGEQAGGVVVCRQAAGIGRHREGALSGASSQAAVAGWQQSLASQARRTGAVANWHATRGRQIAALAGKAAARTAPAHHAAAPAALLLERRKGPATHHAVQVRKAVDRRVYGEAGRAPVGQTTTREASA
jgi:hypothetical protein